MKLSCLIFFLFITLFAFGQAEYKKVSDTSHYKEIRGKILNEDLFLKIDPKNAEHYFKRGTYYKMIGNYQQALTDLNKALELRPNNAPSFYNRGNVYEKLANFKKQLTTIVVQ